MVEIRTVVACVQCGSFWDAETTDNDNDNDTDTAAADTGTGPGTGPGTARPCTQPDHEHVRFDLHLHRTRVVLPGGAELTAVSFGGVDPYLRDAPPDFGLYLDDRWNPPWAHELLDWPDFGVPSDPAAVAATLESLLDRARAGEHVELGCFGGHGRTGTALACIAILCGVPAAESVAWVRAEYCDRAVETDEQQAFISTFACADPACADPACADPACADPACADPACADPACA